ARRGGEGGVAAGVGGRRGAAGGGDLEAAGRGREPELGRASPLLAREEDPLPRRPLREDPVDPGGGEEVGIGAVGGDVEGRAVVPERGDRSGQGPAQHAATLSSRAM